jgi:hypothetical protein
MVEGYRLGEPYQRPRHKGFKVLVLLCTLMAITILPALAARGGNGGGKGKGSGGGGTTGGTSSLAYRVLTGTDTTPNWGEQVTFDVQTTATAKPLVQLNCYQGDEVYAASAGFWDGYPWPQDQIFTLKSSVWTGGGADCTARLYSSNGNGGFTTITTIGFRVEA